MTPVANAIIKLFQTYPEWDGDGYTIWPIGPSAKIEFWVATGPLFFKIERINAEYPAYLSPSLWEKFYIWFKYVRPVHKEVKRLKQAEGLSKLG